MIDSSGFHVITNGLSPLKGIPILKTPSIMQWPHLLSARRFKVNEGRVEDAHSSGSDAGLRTDFHVDHDRVVFSGAFRRLGRKTQVHPFALNDLTHNRLTHSVEVGCVGRSLGNRVGAMLAEGRHLPSDISPSDIGTIVQVACLAHDIGNPPFGHIGEEALRDWFLDPRHQHYLATLSPVERLDIQTYEGNAHSLRMVTSLEMYGDEGGMRLTSAVLGTLVKYPWTVDTFPERRKFNFYQSERAYYAAVAAELGLLEVGSAHWVRHPLSYLMEAADDICYAILDLEDAVEIDILDVHEFEALLTPLAEIERVWRTVDPRQKCALLRGMAVGRCVADVAHRFIAHHEALLHGHLPAKDLITLCEGPVRDALDAAKSLASNKVYRHRTKLVTEIAAFPCLAVLLNCLVPAVHVWCTQGPSALSIRQQAELALLVPALTPGDTLYTGYMKVLDYLGAMTDNHAARLAREISGIGLL